MNLARLVSGFALALIFACGGSAPAASAPATPPPSFFGDEFLRVNVTELRATPLFADIQTLAHNMPRDHYRRVVQHALSNAELLIVGGARANDNETTVWLRLAQPDNDFAATLRSFELTAQTDASGLTYAQAQEQGETFYLTQLSAFEYLLVTGSAWAPAIATHQEQMRYRQTGNESVEPNAFVHAETEQVAFAFLRLDLNEMLGMAENANINTLSGQNLALNNANKVPVEASVLRTPDGLTGSMIAHEATAESAGALANRAQQGLANARSNPMMAMLGMQAILNSLAVQAQGSNVHGRGVFPYGDMSRILALLGARLSAGK